MTSRDIRNKRHSKKDHKKRIWLIIRKRKMTNDVLNGNSIHDYLNYLAERNRHNLLMRDHNITTAEYAVAQRFLKIAVNTDKCDSLAHDMAMTINEGWLDDDVVLQHIYSNFKAYWDRVIDTYKSRNAKSKRLNYLIEKLKEDQYRVEIREHDSIRKLIQDLIAHYQDTLNKQQ